ncbi:MAG: DUF2085 domain-containing protein [Chloroflexota bacterium]|nr:DUF2085 domain-containing protein [Chloroflexota bacterium]
MTQPNNNNRKLARGLNRGVLNMSRNWLRIALIIVGIYAGLPYVAPMLMQAGLTGPARVLYAMYSPFCHQMAFRSAFLFGEQVFYPREVSGTELTPFEVYASQDPYFAEIDLMQFSSRLILSTRDFVGNETMGYKMTLCARDVAIYTFLFLGGVTYSIPFVRQRLRPIPIWLYLLLGITPIGIDGMSQLLSYPPFNLWPVRETAPEFRVITGALFGLMTAWLAFPYLEASFRETRDTIEDKFTRAGLPT